MFMQFMEPLNRAKQKCQCHVRAHVTDNYKKQLASDVNEIKFPTEKQIFSPDGPVLSAKEAAAEAQHWYTKKMWDALDKHFREEVLTGKTLLGRSIKEGEGVGAWLITGYNKVVDNGDGPVLAKKDSGHSIFVGSKKMAGGATKCHMKS